MVHVSSVSSLNIYVQHLKRCMRSNALADARAVHAHMVIERDASNIILENTLIDVYAKCGSLEDAKCVFDKIKQPNLFSWTAIITGYAQNRQFEDVVGLFESMQCANVLPDRLLLMLIINACTNLAALYTGELIHAFLVEYDYSSDSSIGKNLVEMYKKCGKLQDASEVFEQIESKDVVLWTAMVSGFVQHGFWSKALCLFQRMNTEGVEPNDFTFVTITKACGGLEALECGMCIHSWILEGSLDSNTHITNSLLDMYFKCCCLNDGLTVFKKMNNVDVISWTTIIAGYAQAALYKEALLLFDQMYSTGVKPNSVTYHSTLQACAGMGCFKCGMRMHMHILKSEIYVDVLLQNALIEMYTKCGCMREAQCIFDGMHDHQLVTWTAIITCYIELGVHAEAVSLFKRMQMEGNKADDIVLVSVLKACAALKALHSGKQFHTQIVESELLLETMLGSALIDMYSKCGKMDYANRVFCRLHEPDVVSWTAIIAGYGENGLGKEAFSLFEEMIGVSVLPNLITYISILKIIANIRNMERGRDIHKQLVCIGLNEDTYIQSSLVDFYAKSKNIIDAQSVFDCLQNPDQVAWNALIAGYIQVNIFQYAFVLYERMQQLHLQPGAITHVSIVKACVELEDLESGKEVHGIVIERGCESDVHVLSSLINMYAKCGCLHDAHVLFQKMKSPDLVTWNAILGGCAQQGQSKDTIELFEKMKLSCVKPDITTLGCVLAACSHGGLLDKGKHYFDVMTQDFGFTPLPWHCACIVDLYGRAGRLTDAKDFISKLPIQPDGVVWMTMLAACRNYSNVTLGQFAFQNVIRLNPNNASAYVLMSNIYVAAGMRDEAASVRRQMEMAGLNDPGSLNMESILHGKFELLRWITQGGS